MVTHYARWGFNTRRFQGCSRPPIIPCPPMPLNRDAAVSPRTPARPQTTAHGGWSASSLLSVSLLLLLLHLPHTTSSLGMIFFSFLSRRAIHSPPSNRSSREPNPPAKQSHVVVGASEDMKLDNIISKTSHLRVNVSARLHSTVCQIGRRSWRWRHDPNSTAALPRTTCKIRDQGCPSPVTTAARNEPSELEAP
jgi:hypothetical protein